MRIICYYGVIGSGQKWSGKYMVHAWMDTIHNKYKNITLTKNKSLLFFHAVYHRKEHVIPQPVISAILDVILNILQC